MYLWLPRKHADSWGDGAPNRSFYGAEGAWGARSQRNVFLLSKAVGIGYLISPGILSKEQYLSVWGWVDPNVTI